ncbi:hypothetical protein BgiBS90_009026, partial [Biomphalaria glabrata]
SSDQILFQILVQSLQYRVFSPEASVLRLQSRGFCLETSVQSLQSRVLSRVFSTECSVHNVKVALR